MIETCTDRAAGLGFHICSCCCFNGGLLSSQMWAVPMVQSRDKAEFVLEFNILLLLFKLFEI